MCPEQGQTCIPNIEDPLKSCDCEVQGKSRIKMCYEAGVATPRKLGMRADSWAEMVPEKANDAAEKSSEDEVLIV